MTDAQIRAKCSMSQSETSMFFACCHKKLERNILSIELITPATDLYGPQLWMVERLPILECLPIHHFIIPAHQFKIIFFRVPAKPGNEVAGANASFSWHIP